MSQIDDSMLHPGRDQVKEIQRWFSGLIEGEIKDGVARRYAPTKHSDSTCFRMRSGPRFGTRPSG